MNNKNQTNDIRKADQRKLIDVAWQQICQMPGTNVFSVENKTKKNRDALAFAFKDPVMGSLPGYKLVEEIHRGGQGVVYRGIQLSTGQKVAIKVVLGGSLAGPMQLARFQREIAILARLKHPDIVTIYDSGVAEGAAYLIMDLIDGTPLDVHVKQYRLNLADRLKLFARVCEAVHAAHLHGVIHRDLKPGNILIDEQGNPHILDFGLAKPMDLEAAVGTNAPTMTEPGQFIGSLPWASPEQAMGHSDDIDIRTDVYSLGVLLYRILTDEFPYKVTGSIHEIIQTIAHAAPVNPRTRNPGLPGDVATIVLSAIAKEPGRRYQSADLMARDIRSYLSGDPIDARRSSAFYVLTKRLLRHKWITGLAFLIFLTISVGLVASLHFWHLAEQRADQAVHQAERASGVTKFLTDILSSANPENGGRTDVKIREVIDDAAHRLDAHPLYEQPALECNLRLIIGKAYGSVMMSSEQIKQLEICRKLTHEIYGHETPQSMEAWMGIGDAQRRLGNAAESKKTFEKCLEYVQCNFGNDNELLPMIYNGLAAIARDQGDYTTSQKHSLDGLAAWESSGKSSAIQKAILLNDLGLCYSNQEKHQEAIQCHQEALGVFKDVLGPEHYQTAISISNLAGALGKTLDYKKSEVEFDRALAIFRKVVGTDHEAVANCLDSKALMLSSQSKFSESAKLQRMALEIRKKAPDRNELGLAQSMNNLAICHYEAGELEQAIAMFTEAMNIYRKLRGPTHPTIAQFLVNIAGANVSRGHVEEAADLIREAMEISIKNYTENSVKTAAIQTNLGRVLLELGKYDEAESIFRRALATRMTISGNDSAETASVKEAFCRLLVKANKLEEAEKLCREALAVREVKKSRDPLATGECTLNLALILSARHKHEEAMKLAETGIALVDKGLPKDNWRSGSLRVEYGRIFTAASKFEKAEKELLAAHHILVKTTPIVHPRHAACRRELASLYDKWNKPAEASKWRSNDTQKSRPSATVL